MTIKTDNTIETIETTGQMVNNEAAEPASEDAGGVKHRLHRRVAAVALMLVLLLCSVWFMQKFMCIPFSYDEMRIINFHKEPENTIDVLLIGSSAAYADYSAPYAYENFGFTSYPYAIGGATCTMWKPALKDALRTQRPKLVVIDVFGGGYKRNIIEDRSNQLSIAMSHTAFSKEKIDTAKELSSQVDGMKPADFLFPFIKYHNNIPSCAKRLPERIQLEFDSASPLKGVSNKACVRKLAKVKPESFTDEPAPLDDKTEAVIRDFIDYCKSENLEVLFVKFPLVLTNKHPKELNINLRANRILEIAHERGFHALNMQKYFNEIGLDERKDFYNHGHTNTRGQKKITAYLGGYIRDELGQAASQLDEENRKKWDETIPYYNAYCELSEALIKGKKHIIIGDGHKVVSDLKRIVDGSDVDKIAKEYINPKGGKQRKR